MASKPSYRINEAIRAPEVRVIDKTGKQIGVLPTREALELARKEEVDLVEVSPSAQPPVVRIVDLKKWIFEREKQAEGKKGKKSELKEFRIRPNIGENDLAVRAHRAEDFLRKGDRVKLTVVFRGREFSHPEVGLEKLQKMTEFLKESGKPEGEPVRMQRGYELNFVPKSNA